jgi:glycosyltransferase involved in cell wall biosynthesis
LPIFQKRLTLPLSVDRLWENLMADKLTVLIPCKDECRNIRPCIESVLSIADELLIADSGSTDGTLEIVRDVFDGVEGDCRLIEREYVNSADFKNWSIPQAKHEWVLVVDADERVPPQLAEEIGRVLANPPSEIDGYWIGRDNHYLGHRIRHCGWNSDDVLRLFRRDSGQYQKRWVHAEVVMDDARTRRLDTAFLHYTTWNTDDYLFKMNRYAAWGALNFRDEKGRKTAGVLPMLTRAPLRFLQLYLLRLGFLDGIPGLQVCMITAFYSFLKQAKLWELHNAVPQPDPEAGRGQSGDDDAETIDITKIQRTRIAPPSGATPARRVA